MYRTRSTHETTTFDYLALLDIWFRGAIHTQHCTHSAKLALGMMRVRVTDADKDKQSWIFLSLIFRLRIEFLRILQKVVRNFVVKVN